MIDAILEIEGFTKHLGITEDMVRYGRLQIPVSKQLLEIARGGPSPNCSQHLNILEFVLIMYDKEHNTAYFGNPRWV